MNYKIPLFYWSERKFTFKKKENYGDLLSKYIVEKISGSTTGWVHPKKQPWYMTNKSHFLAIGSILHHATKYSKVWGSGIIDRKHPVAPAEFLAVRGPQTRKYLLESGHSCPEIYGDPALLLPEIFTPEVEKKYKIGVIPHYNDYKIVDDLFRNEDEVLVIDLMTMDVEEVTFKILQCESTISSSLHGLIVSHAYDIPSVWVEFSNNIFGDGIKYRDYLESVDIPFYKAPFIDEKYDQQTLTELVKTYRSLPEKDKLIELQQGLMSCCPFISQEKVQTG